jgi:hypothetical protein
MPTRLTPTLHLTLAGAEPGGAENAPGREILCVDAHLLNTVMLQFRRPWANGARLSGILETIVAKMRQPVDHPAGILLTLRNRDPHGRWG